MERPVGAIVGVRTCRMMAITEADDERRIYHREQP